MDARTKEMTSTSQDDIMYPQASTNVLLPKRNRLESFWLSERDSSLSHFCSTETLPEQADIVIVGSGISGALIAREIYAQWREEKNNEEDTVYPTVLMLEAGETCGGATARNGGHCKPLTYLGFQTECSKRGAATANAMYDFEASHLSRYVQLVQEEDLDCDLVVTRAFDVLFDRFDAENARKDYESRKAMFPESMRRGDIVSVEDPGDLERLSGIKGGQWGCHYPAAHLWPYKLATQLIQKQMHKGMALHTFTSVISLERDPSSSSSTVITSRGRIEAKAVIVASNGYTAGFLSEFKDRIVPVRGTACSITPPSSHSLGSVPGPLKHTYGLRFRQGEMDYMIPRQGRGRIPGVGDRSIILGGAKGCFLKDTASWYDNIDDDSEMPGAREYFQGYMRKHFVGWEGEDEKGDVDKVWSGVLGYSNDLLPFVGELPGKEGIFVSAGFTGHGMPRIPACSEAIAHLVVSLVRTGRVKDSARATFERIIPQPYVLTQDRLDCGHNLILEAMGQAYKTGTVAVDELAGLQIAKENQES